MGDDFDKIIENIKSIKIQGATNIAKAGVAAYVKCPSKKCAKKILNTRPTEPLLQNFIKELEKSKKIKETELKLNKYIETSQKKIAKNGAKLIKNGMNIFTHCHSSSVIGILKEAKRQKKKFHVYTIEVEPLLQGRMTARELAKVGIKTTVGPDLAAEQLIRGCDLFLFGVDAFTPRGVINKIGTSTLCKLAKMHGIPRYCCGVAMKYTKHVKIEKRAGREVWKDNKKEIEVVYPAFDKTSWKLISGVIFEDGAIRAKGFVKEQE
jgi:translation initiation factor 2B subunit (eIF-2B alpha/beta/delta family)